VHPLQRRFGAVLRRRREAAGLSQEALAAEAGLHRNYVGLLERGQRMPTILAAEQLATALGTTASRLLAEVEREPAPDDAAG
jgi:transcriptional regulator with XRE-family HTH domain